ncbi:MAG: prolyl-tRNA synthetase [Gammaproteobacteria bacterium]|nr:prolyl-tRNA synthetase [Gammaproteobacteria bacterium]
MRQSQLSSKTLKDSSAEDPSINAQLLTRAGFVDRLMAGVFSYLPLGTRVLWKIENIIRDEMNRIGSEEVLMPALQPQSIWEETGRWDKMSDVLYRIITSTDKFFTLGATHEEVVTPLIGRFIQSYKDLPKSVYQIQTKFRNEARPKSGVLRGREFRMKDMYSFHTSQEDLDSYYDRSIGAYHTVYRRCGLGDQTYLTYASGGAFCKYSHEFQTVTPFGEDHIHLWEKKDVAVNQEIIDDVKETDEWKGAQFSETKAIEVGNIFKLGTRFADAFKVRYQDQSGTMQPVYMGCYGIGSTRILGTIAEVSHDNNGLIWPIEVAPFHVHLIRLGTDDAVIETADRLFAELTNAGIEVLYDDREVNAGTKFADSDLIGIPSRMVISAKTLKENLFELKQRHESNANLHKLTDAENTIRNTW